MAAHDIPCMIDYVLKTTGKENLYYAGHSQGTMVGFIQFSQDQEFAKKIKHFYALGPVATVHHIKGPLKLIAPLTKIMDNFLKTFGVNDFTVPPTITKALADIVCKGDIGNPLCDSVMFLFCGPDSKQLNTTRTPVYVAHFPAGTSTKNIAHFSQMVNSGRFCKYDYGMIKNKEIYGSYSPPEYDPSNMQTPVSLYWGGNDWLADPNDIEQYLLPKLQNIQGNYKFDSFNHLDFILGMDAPQMVYTKIIKSIKEQEGAV